MSLFLYYGKPKMRLPKLRGRTGSWRSVYLFVLYWAVRNSGLQSDESFILAAVPPRFTALPLLRYHLLAVLHPLLRHHLLPVAESDPTRPVAEKLF